jgi:hypothetical protein
MAEKTDSSRAKSVLGGKKESEKKASKKSGKKPHKIHIRRGKSGGYIAEHHFQNSPDEEMQEPEEHVVPDLDSLRAHIAEHLGDQGPAETAPPEPAPSPDQTASAGPPPSAAPQATPSGM